VPAGVASERLSGRNRLPRGVRAEMELFVTRSPISLSELILGVL
jgi:hypothetical protein